jgi:RNA polymerase sigma-70 factor, ECF subfamily
VSFPIQSDQSLVARIRGGDERAASVLYARYSKRILGLVESKLSDRMKVSLPAEDIVQSIFKSIFRGVTAGGYDAPEGGTLWQLIAVVAIHKVRRKGARSTSLKRDVRRTELLGTAEEEELYAPQSAAEFEIGIEESMECLKLEEREVVCLRLENFTVEEISEKLGRSRRSVERLLQGIRSKLSDFLMVDDATFSDESDEIVPN